MRQEENTIIPRNKNWFVVYTKSRHEKRVAERFEEINIDYYLPVQTVVKKWSDRKKKITEAIFKSYIFVRIGLLEYEKVLQTDSVVGFVKFSKYPEIVPVRQIDLIKRILDSDYELNVDAENYDTGDSVEVIFGPLAGIVGELVEIKGASRLVVHIDSLGKNMVVTIPVKYVKKIKGTELEQKISKLQRRFLG